MENLNRTNRWKKKPSHRSPILSFSLIALFLSLLIFISYNHISTSLLPFSTNSQQTHLPQCGSIQTLGEKFLWYAPHSGFSNQLSELKNAILMAAILNRTLVVPPVLDHHAVALGSCPKFRVLNPSELRSSVWNHSIELIRSHRYISMGDIIDLSPLVSSLKIRVIDFRFFASLWCGLNRDFACSSDSDIDTSLFGILKKCGSVLSGNNGNIDKCLYALDEDCRTTIWTYQKDGEDGVLDSFQPDEQLKKKKKISYVRRRRDVSKTLGPGSKTELATVLAFGSLFTTPYRDTQLYIDIHEAPRDQRMKSLIEKVEFLPFVPEIASAGKEFASETIKVPFVCAQLRLLDGQFKNHWKTTFLGLKQKIESLRKKGSLPIHVFVMTDLPESNWTGSYLGELMRESDAFKMYFLNEDNVLVIRTAKKVISKSLNGMQRHCGAPLLPDIRLYVEETICSCASLGFVGTAGSTIAESIELMRKHGVCADNNLLKS